MLILFPGVHTGSKYSTQELREAFPGELHSAIAGDVIVVKTHSQAPFIVVDGETRNYSRVVLVIRNVVDALKAEYTRRIGNSATFVLSQVDQKGGVLGRNRFT